MIRDQSTPAEQSEKASSSGNIPPAPLAQSSSGDPRGCTKPKVFADLTADLRTLGLPQGRDRPESRPPGLAAGDSTKQRLKDVREWSPDLLHAEDFEPMVALKMQELQNAQSVGSPRQDRDSSKEAQTRDFGGGEIGVAPRVVGRLTIPCVPSRLAWCFLDDFLDLVHPMIPILQPHRLRAVMAEYCSAASKVELPKQDLVYILIVLAVGAGSHAVALQAANSRIRDEAMLRVYQLLVLERVAHEDDTQTSRSWFQPRFCAEKAADLYTAARFLVVDLEAEEPSIEVAKCFRLLASFNLSQNLWRKLWLVSREGLIALILDSSTVAFSFGCKAVMMSMALKLHTLSPHEATTRDKEEEAREDVWKLWICCATFDKLSV